MSDDHSIAGSTMNGAGGDVNASELLTGRIEARDLQSVSLDDRMPDIGYNTLFRRGLVQDPVVDRQYLENGGVKPEWPNDADFAVCLTHDVDEVSKFSFRQSLRELARLRRVRELPISSAMTLLKQTATSLIHQARGQQDPYHAYERWLEVEEEVGGRSTFFFMPEAVSEPHSTDPDYTFSDTVVFDGEPRSVAGMMREIDRRGWEVGLHPTWHTFDDPDELARQKAQIEAEIDSEIVSVRQHFLHYDINKTPLAHARAGLRFDSTLGFNNGVGFRFGTSYPWQLYDLEGEERLPILEVPLVIQDGALLNRKGLSLDPDAAFDYVVQLVEAVEAVGGVLTISWHTRFVASPDWWNLYVRILDYLGSKDVWFASVEDIGDWWLDHGFNIIQ